ncbi:hypothetical protein GKC29_25340 [Micromonospora sp. WMMC415]|uniref:hypothetical protein n=1 Tax=Micromonospora sp. WMMC415 TaxID=2675222 RepID=UPI0012B4F757|nr:hypothetical protein [Micromonospora sp. WMMC415]QGN49820.1 hypothetical protein GKC29_25340 [Micromonospora sp. WMMC415]
MNTGRTAAAVSVGVIVAVLGACGALVIACTGFWVVFGPVNYFGCGTERPAGITAADLAGSYATDDGGRLELRPDGTLTASGLDNSDGFESRPPLSGPGKWFLEPADNPFGDIDLIFESPPGYNGGYGTDLNISGSRTDPWLYWYVGDPDSCVLYRFNRV